MTGDCSKPGASAQRLIRGRGVARGPGRVSKDKDTNLAMAVAGATESGEGDAAQAEKRERGWFRHSNYGSAA